MAIPVSFLFQNLTMRFISAFLFSLFAFASYAQTTKSYYITADRIFNGETMHTGWAVLVENDKIVAVGPKEKIASTNAVKINYPNSTLTPGLI